jgi:hypothetical protein
MSLCVPGAILCAQETDTAAYPVTELTPLLVSTPSSANEDPAAGFATPLSSLRYAPEIDLQSRGMPEGQSDLSIRGGVFEQTSVVLGAVPLLDPQTGHYTGEVPFDPAMLRAPELEMGAANGLHGFNSTIATLRYGWAQIEPRGEVSAGLGTDEMYFGSGYAALLLGESADSHWALDLGGGWSKGESPIEDGDYDLKRFSMRLQHVGASSQTDFYFGYLDKLYGWPGMYVGTAFSRLFPESDDYQATVAGVNHHQRYGEDSWWEAGVAFRQVDDDYEFNRDNPSNGFEHLTRAWSAAVTGKHRLGPQLSVEHKVTFVADDLVRSTSLTSGDATTGNDFTAREYLTGAILPTYEGRMGSQIRWTAAAGVTFAMSSEDKGFVGPMAHLAVQKTGNDGRLWTVYLDAAQTSQVPGYTALRSAPNGLFGGNANLGREYAETLEFGGRLEQGPWMIGAGLFTRYDNDVVDWTFNRSASSARQANPVEVRNLGWETLLGYRVERWEVRLSYVGLDKSTDYQNATVDASFYVQNFARHRVTASAVFHPTEAWDLRLDAAWREQAENSLRNSDATALHVSASLWWRPAFLPQTEFSVLVDNLTDDDFEPFPGTPAFGRQVSGRITYRW